MAWGKNTFRDEYRRLLPEIKKYLNKENTEESSDLEKAAATFEKYGSFIAGSGGKHPLDLLRNHHMAEVFIYAILKVKDSKKDLRKLLYSELKKEDAKALEERYLEGKIDEIEDYQRPLHILLGRNQFLQLCKKYFGNVQVDYKIETPKPNEAELDEDERLDALKEIHKSRKRKKI